MGRKLGGHNAHPYPFESHRNFVVFGIYGHLNPKELAAFKGMHNRVRDGKVPSISWPRDWKGFKRFLDHVGNIPRGMKNPSIGRKKHAKGYLRGNVKWEEHALNSRKRKGTRYES